MDAKNNFFNRHTIRLQNYDYSREGLYFITICTYNRMELFGKIENGEMILNNYGRIVDKYWNKIPKHYPDVELLEYVIMPNHFHGILWFTKYIGNNNDYDNIVGAIHELPLQRLPLQLQHRKNRRKMALPKIIGRFKMQSAKEINLLQKTSGQPVWQRNYFEHIIRNENFYIKIAEYIINNPLKWEEDKYYVPNP
jgi:REP element-mobilizing transposase RayT